MLSQPRSGDGEGATARYGVSVGVSVITLEGDQHTDIIGAGTVCTDGETRYGQRVHHISIGLHSRKILGEGLLIPVVLGYSELDHGILQIPLINVCTGGSHLYGSILLAACGDRINRATTSPSFTMALKASSLSRTELMLEVLNSSSSMRKTTTSFA